MSEQSSSNNSLGFHRDMSAAVFGEDSNAVKFLDKKIAESPKGRDEEVVAEESQVVYMLMQIHEGAVRWDE
jgi:predicted RNA-binding protein (virulence factor B family)